MEHARVLFRIMQAQSSDTFNSKAFGLAAAERGKLVRGIPDHELVFQGLQRCLLEELAWEAILGVAFLAKPEN